MRWLRLSLERLVEDVPVRVVAECASSVGRSFIEYRTNFRNHDRFPLTRSLPDMVEFVRRRGGLRLKSVVKSASLRRRIESKR